MGSGIIMEEFSREYLPLHLPERNSLTDDIRDSLGLRIIGEPNHIVRQVIDDGAERIIADIGTNTIKVYTSTPLGRKLAKYIESYGS